MVKKLFLLDGMALVYRAHFAFINRPVRTSNGTNTSALLGFINVVLDLINRQEPTHLAVAFDTEAPTERHEVFPDYKAQREEMPEDLAWAIPQVGRLLEAFRIPLIAMDGYEADDLIGTLSRRAESQEFVTYMVTSDKDFCQLVSEKTFLYKPSRMGDGVEILGVPEVLKNWGIERVDQVTDILALWGDTSDNIPGIPGIGEKTAKKLIARYGSVENLLQHTDELKGKQRENLETHRDLAMLCKQLVTINCEVPITIQPEELKRQSNNEPALKGLLVEFEFNAVGRRLFGDSFQAGRGFQSAGPAQMELAGASSTKITADPSPAASLDQGASLRTIQDLKPKYQLVDSEAARARLIRQLERQSIFCFDTETTSLSAHQAKLVGLAFCFETGTGYFVPLPDDSQTATEILEGFRPVLEDPRIEKIGHNLKYDLTVLQWHGIRVEGKLFDTMLAHSLLEPDMRHGMDYLAQAYLGYRPIPITELIGDKKSEQITMREVPLPQLVDYAVEDADITWQLHAVLEPPLKGKGLERVFYEVECPLISVLVDMELAGIKFDPETLAQYSQVLAADIAAGEQEVQQLAGRPFNLNSPRQLGEVLFGDLKLADKPKKTKTGQYATDEQTLTALAWKHPMIQWVLDYRTASKLKSTYVDVLPEEVSPRTGCIHTTFNQAVTSTGRLQSQNPNLQNIPIRTALGKEIRKAFVPRDKDYELLSADYSQIELRIIAALSQDSGMKTAFVEQQDIHRTTAAKVYRVPLSEVTSEMRRKAKMVNFGIIYGISAFGLAQRLGIPRREAAEIIEQYFEQFPRIQLYMQDTIEFAREHGYVQTVTGRRRYLPDVRSANATVRGAAERNAINTPIQGTAADMIKLAMIHIQQTLRDKASQTRMLLQVHDELVFDLHRTEKDWVLPMVEEKMKSAIPLGVPLEVEMGLGKNWLEAH